jgi:hypothetical protein
MAVQATQWHHPVVRLHHIHDSQTVFLLSQNPLSPSLFGVNSEALSPLSGSLLAGPIRWQTQHMTVTQDVPSPKWNPLLPTTSIPSLHDYQPPACADTGTSPTSHASFHPAPSRKTVVRTYNPFNYKFCLSPTSCFFALLTVLHNSVIPPRGLRVQLVGQGWGSPPNDCWD